MKKSYIGLKTIDGPLISLKAIEGVGYGELINIETGDNEYKTGKVIKIEEESIIAQVFETTSGMSTEDTLIRFTGEPFTLKLSKDIMGRVFNGLGKPIDGGGEIYTGKSHNINGRPINPVARQYPRNFIQTGISSIDCLTTLIRGQKLPIFSGNGLSHNELAAQIVKQAKISSESDKEFAIVFASIGSKHDDANFFIRSFEESGVLDNVVMYINYADDPIAERTTTPRCALTAAEYLAFEENMEILVIMTDITSYSEGLRQISSAREEVPSRKGYPGYLYSDLASLYERAGMLEDRDGSITFLPILTMPNDDITHPIPDLTGYITEGQIVLARDLDTKDIYPPVDILSSLSRLMKDGIGEGYTREDHPDVSNQLFSSYSQVVEIRELAQIIGEDDLSDSDKKYMKFGREFEGRFLKQGHDENRSIEETLNLAWEILAILPENELDRIDPKLIDKYARYKRNE